ncbi:hypothetical protein AGMMS4957_11100 [Bacteroidia bacterium]|nr:hypothetical protein AGMMS4957_11100 [Bacteroidia bacterium]
MTKKTPMVSVVVPIYNMEAYLAETMQSILASHFADFEIVLVDDGSKDKSVEIANTFARDFANVRVFTQQNSGVSAARNHAIREAKGKYILPVDADDLISPDFIDSAVEVLENNPQIKVVGCRVERFGEKQGEKKYPKFSLRLLARKNMIVNSSMFRKADWEKTKGYCEEEIFCEDWDFWLSLFETGGEYVRLPFIGLQYRVRINSRRSDVHTNKKKMVNLINQRHKEFIHKQLGGKLHYHRTWSRLLNFFQ